MADISVDPWAWSSNEANNDPAGSTAVGTGLAPNLRAIQAAVRAAFEPLTSVAGTNTITASMAGLTAYASGLRVCFLPANTTTGATTININSIGAKNIFCAGRACVGGELVQNVPTVIEYDGTQFNVVGPLDINSLTEDTSPNLAADYLQTYDASATSFKKVLAGRLGGGISGTKQASTSGTSIDFTSIPSWAKKIIVQFVGVSTSGTSNLIVQIGDSGGVEATGYSGAATLISTGVSTSNFTTGYGLTAAVSGSSVLHGNIVLTLQDASTFTWASSSILAGSDAAQVHVGAGSKSTSAALDRVRITTAGGTDTFDAGSINILYE